MEQVYLIVLLRSARPVGFPLIGCVGTVSVSDQMKIATITASSKLASNCSLGQYAGRERRLMLRITQSVASR